MVNLTSKLHKLCFDIIDINAPMQKMNIRLDRYAIHIIVIT